MVRARLLHAAVSYVRTGQVHHGEMVLADETGAIEVNIASSENAMIEQVKNVKIGQVKFIIFFKYFHWFILFLGAEKKFFQGLPLCRLPQNDRKYAPLLFDVWLLEAAERAHQTWNSRSAQNCGREDFHVSKGCQRWRNYQFAIWNVLKI